MWTLPGPEGAKYTTVLDRSPYGEDGTELVSDAFVPFGFAAVGQDFRGTGRSSGDFDLWQNVQPTTFASPLARILQPCNSWATADRAAALGFPQTALVCVRVGAMVTWRRLLRSAVAHSVAGRIQTAET